MNAAFCFALFLVLCAPGLAQEPKILIGEIEFFGTNGFDLKAIRAGLPVAEDEKVSPADMPGKKIAIAEAIKRSTGRDPSDVVILCCNDRGAAIIYIGLPQTEPRAFRYKPAPQGTAQLMNDGVQIYEDVMKLTSEAVRTQAGEDHARGYALSLYPPLRARQLASREYALKHEELLHRVVLRSADAKQRAIAAHLLGYGRQSKRQIATLVSASRDPSDEVRNNAVRALGVLAKSNPVLARSIPADTFIGMLNSGTWTDRNKGSFVLAMLSANREPGLLGRLRRQALPALIEMARWRSHSHADYPRTILGRVGGIEEDELLKLVVENKTEEIVRRSSLTRQ
jgi:hypothetical protein